MKTVIVVRRSTEPAAILNATEIETYHALPDAKRQDWLAGRTALKTAYCHYIEETDLQAVVVSNTEAGNPYIAHNTDLACSIAHAAGVGCGAVSDHAIGVDIEMIQNRADVMHDAVAHKDEQKKFRAMFDSDSEYITCMWTLKEAVVKAMTVGVVDFPREITVESMTVHPAGTIEATIATPYDEVLWGVYAERKGNCYCAVAQPLDTYYVPRIDWY